MLSNLPHRRNEESARSTAGIAYPESKISCPRITSGNGSGILTKDVEEGHLHHGISHLLRCKVDPHASLALELGAQHHVECTSKNVVFKPGLFRTRQSMTIEHV